MVNVPPILENMWQGKERGGGGEDEHKTCDPPWFPTSFYVLYLAKYKVQIWHPWPKTKLFSGFLFTAAYKLHPLLQFMVLQLFNSTYYRNHYLMEKVKLPVQLVKP